MNVHGGDIYTYMSKTGIVPLDYSANINPLGLPEPVKRVLADNIDSFSPYPDIHCRRLARAMSEFEKVDESFLLFGNGAADIIFKTVYALKPKSALLLAPTFAEYEIALANTNCRINYHHLYEKDEFALTEDIIGKIKGVDIVFICNPNNPTGMVTPKELIYKIAEKCTSENAYLVLDECFMDFVEGSQKYSFKEFIGRFDNVLILKAFTKIFSMAGLRLGYCISSNKGLLESINKAGQPWSVSTPAQLAGIAACGEKEHVKKTVHMIRKEREFLYGELKAAGLKPYESYANYILIKGERDLYDRLLKEHIIIRRCSNYIGLDDSFFRIAVKMRKDNEKLIGAIKNG